MDGRPQNLILFSTKNGNITTDPQIPPETEAIQHIDNIVSISILIKSNNIESIMKKGDDIRKGDLAEESMARYHKRAAPTIRRRDRKIDTIATIV